MESGLTEKQAESVGAALVQMATFANEMSGACELVLAQLTRCSFACSV